MNTKSNEEPSTGTSLIVAGPFDIAVLAMSAAGMILAMIFGLLPLMFGLLGARAASLWIARTKWLSTKGRWAKFAGSATVGAIAIAVLVALSLWVVDSGSRAVKEAPTMAKKISEQARVWRAKLPEALAQRIPEEDSDIQAVLSEMIGSQLPSLAVLGKAWAGGALLAFIGWIIGLLMANMEPPSAPPGPLSSAMRASGSRFSDMFKKIVVGQFFVACANTVFAALYMFVVLPLAGMSMPWAPALVGMTLVVSMIPVAGNVLCNGVVALVALTVSPALAAASLVYLILVHKVEYFINAKVVGKRVSAAVWELLLAMFVLEAIFGVAGLVAAPLFFAYSKQELKRIGWL